MKRIQLTGMYRHLEALVDDEDFDVVSQYRWTGGAGYAVAKLPEGQVRMHRLLMDAPKGMVVDHINGNTLDNRRSNLRVVTQAENTRNSKAARRLAAENAKPRAAIYVRQSLDKQGDGLAISRQEDECRRLCEQRGLRVVEVFSDNSVSASFAKIRPSYHRLIETIERREVEYVIVLRLDRLLRKLTELEALIELSERTGVQIVTVQGDLDISNAQGRLLGRILASVARSEVEVKSERHVLANRQRASQGKPHGSRRPYGYLSDLVTIYEPEAEVLRTMARMLISGQGYKHIAHWLNQQGHLTTFGRPWLPVTVRNMLRKPRYGGFREYRGELFPAQWPAIFEPELYEQLQLTMRMKREKAPDRPRGRKYLLTGLAYCGKCGLPLTGTAVVDRPDAPKRRIYMCRGQRDTGLVRGCGGVRRNADALDHYVRETVFAYLDVPELAELLNDGDDGQVRSLLDQRQAQQLKLDALVDDYATGLLNRQEFARAKTAAEAALKATEQELDKASRKQLKVDLAAGESLREAWDKSSDEWRRQLLSVVVKKITVKPGITKPYYYADGQRYRFDPSLVEIEWAS